MFFYVKENILFRIISINLTENFSIFGCFISHTVFLFYFRLVSVFELFGNKLMQVNGCFEAYPTIPNYEARVGHCPGVSLLFLVQTPQSLFYPKSPSYKEVVEVSL